MAGRIESALGIGVAAKITHALKGGLLADNEIVALFTRNLRYHVFLHVAKRTGLKSRMC
jgi:hypothetical protein